MDVDKLSDAELRMKLIEFGFPVMPITGTTRKTMVKKLKMLMDNKSKINADSRRSLAKYSSGEDDSDAEPVKVPKSKRRQTMAAPPANNQASSSVISSSSKKLVTISRNVVHDSDSTTSREPAVVKRQNRGSKMVQMVEEAIDISDSDPDVSDLETSLARRRGKVPSSSSALGGSILKDSKKDSPIKTPNNAASQYESYLSQRTSTPTAGYTSPIRSGASSDAAQRLQQIRSRLSLGTSPYSSPSTSTHTNYSKTDLNADADETPFLSNFTRKLSRLSTNPSALLNDGVKEHDTNNGASTYTRYISRNPRYDNTYGSNYNQGTSDNSKSRSNLVSFALIAVALLFFIVVTVLYLGLHSGNTAIDTSGLVIPYCSKDDTTRQRFTNCLLDSDVKPAVEMYRLVKPELVRRTIQQFCYVGDENRVAGEDDLVGYVEKYGTGEYDFLTLRQHIRSFAVLSLHNPKWDISLTVNPSLLTPLSSTDDLPQPKLGFHHHKSTTTQSQVEQDIGAGTLYMYAREPELPFMCRWLLRMNLAFRSLLVVTGLCCLGYLARKFYVKHQLTQNQHRDEVFLLVERIVELLQTTAEALNTSSTDSTLQTSQTKPQDFLVINHVRDMLLPINDRERLDKTWRDAVKFLNENESRVRTEVQVVRGEQYEVWRWLGNSNTSGASPTSSPRSSNSVSNQSWQGQAFETQAGSVNSLPFSPTPCLKVRGMLNNNTVTNGSTAMAGGDDTSSVSVREAVLAKCAHRCQLLHCNVDQETSAIYLKCQTQADAAVAYRALHGWWYAGHLVTVKYLRLERYMQRFPDAPSTGPPFLRALHPAGDWSN